MSKKDFYEKSIVLIGPTGCGKGLISVKLAQKLKMPIISTGTLKYCPSTLEEIDAEIEAYTKLREDLKEEFRNVRDLRRRKNIRQESNLAKGCIQRLNKMAHARTLCPHVSNYEKLGYDVEVARRLGKKYGTVAWHYYQKQFEGQFLDEIMQDVWSPCILDVDGGLPISLEEQYAKLDKRFRATDENKYLLYSDLDEIGFAKTYEKFLNFKHVVHLCLPENYKNTMLKAGSEPLNELFIATGQYEQLQTSQVCVEGLVDYGEKDEERLEQIVDTIIKTEVE